MGLFGKNRIDIERFIHGKIYFVGMLVEFVALIIALNFLLEIKIDLSSSINWHVFFTSLPVLLALLTLLYHQHVILTSFKYIEEITKENKIDEKYHLVGHETLKSYIECWIRGIIYFLLAGASGEVLYILYTVIIKFHIGPSNELTKFVSIFYTGFTTALCLCVCFWDVIILAHKKKNKFSYFYKNKRAKLIQDFFDDKNIIWLFLVSDIFSFVFWLLIFLSLLKQANNMDVIVVFACLYIFLMFLRWLNEKNVSSPVPESLVHQQ